MSLGSFKPFITRNLLNIPGWRTNRKIVVIESDDWGSIRMASRDTYRYFLKKGYPVDECPYNRYDALECNEDLEKLFNVLGSVKDTNGNPAIITANCVVANPDFKKIKDHNYQKYFFEPVTETLKQYPQHDRVYDLCKKGITQKLFKPQFHGREHLNVALWLKLLQDYDQTAHEVFDRKMFSVHTTHLYKNSEKLTTAFNFISSSEKDHLEEIVSEGALMFNKIWGFRSRSFIAPCYTWSSDLEVILHQFDVKYIQGVVTQIEPELKSSSGYQIKYHYQGQKNRNGQHYLIRNAFFEPAQIPTFEWIDYCLNRIAIAFRWKKPAIISSHRLNYTGFIDPENRHRNLLLLKKLLLAIIKRWPDVEFMTSDDLGDLMH